MTAPEDLNRLRADCGSCFALCCVALPFQKSTDFAITKRAGLPCVNLLADFRCGVHTRLPQEGFRGCTVFDCFGAGQQVAQVTFGGVDWRAAPDTAGGMFEVFGVMRHLHELLWYLTEAVSLPRTRPLHEDLRRALGKVRRLTEGSAEAVAAVDVDAVRGEVDALLTRTSELVRGGVKGPTRNHRGANLMGAKLRGADLRGAHLRGALLIAADLRGADLRNSDLIGADLRDADLRGADLTDCVFLTQSQVNAARGDAATRIPSSVGRPPHWT
ncbi:pentapeptide repeat-containing protein [Actinokineospora spheciospongiae]|uniref:pentapeptide repeat-containing protein n=1 Tax=Actinokineospora spheciospongiae TaxID=909613 RepID=UPI000D70E732|nr:pentapeptide repeat-containing protein [Actinokineospora spheciospongiae]PWW63248.1 pentapeptide repeat protein [Actinokineospora spheciospongiae]